MNAIDLVPWPRTVVHDTRREAVRLGIIVATTTWLWLVLVDATMRQPFHTFDALGGVVAFTAMHFLLNIVYGIVLLSAVHGAERAPSLILAGCGRRFQLSASTSLRWRPAHRARR